MQKKLKNKYAKEPRFILLSKRDKKDIFRIEILLLDRNLGIEDLTGKILPVTPYKIT